LTEIKKPASHVKKTIFRIDTARKITQFCCFLVLNAIVFGLGPWPILLPIVQSPGVPQKTVSDAFSALQVMLYQRIFPWLPIASFLLTAVIFGRALCGWVCPFGFIQDLLRYVKKRHTRVSLRTHGGMLKVKYGILAAVLFTSVTLSISLALGVGKSYESAIGVFAPAPFNALSPADTLFAILPRMVLMVVYAPEVLIVGIISDPLFWVRLTIMIAIIVLAVYVPRSWCRYFCPIGALLAVLNRFTFLGLKRDPLRCTRAGCRTCVDACPMMVRILELPWEKFTDSECIYCLKCVDACPTRAIKPKFP